MNREEVLDLLTTTNAKVLEELWQTADGIVKSKIGNNVYIRGLVEIGNVCERNCFYCGLRKGNKQLERYRIPITEIVEHAVILDQLGYGTIVLQSGEDGGYTADDIAHLVKSIKKKTRLAISLSLGEREPSELALWKKCGADRYFLRFETSNPELFKKVHPVRKNTRISSGHPRMELLKTLQTLGYEVGTGFMVGLPGQTYEDLANDLLYMKNQNIDMIGIGPFIPHPLTPLAKLPNPSENASLCHYVPPTPDMTYRCIAIVRCLCPLTNIPATTALCVLDKNSLPYGLTRGANVVMHDTTPDRYRHFYEIYPGKTKQAPPTLSNLHTLVRSIGKNIGIGPGTSANYGCC